MITELEREKAILADLRTYIADNLKGELASLPTVYGFASVRDFIRALKSAAAGAAPKAAKKRRGRPPGSGKKASASPKEARKGKNAKMAPKGRTRAKVDESTRKWVKVLVDEGKTGAQIAKSLNISIPTVQNIKKSLGLVKARKGAAEVATPAAVPAVPVPVVVGAGEKAPTAT
jgi:hypothetical protein